VLERFNRSWITVLGGQLRNETIDYAHKHFDRGVHVKEYVKLYEKLKEEKNG
jgi:hypothetical protein